MPDKLPTVSIIISAYEGISYLSATIDSLLQQTRTDFEVFIFTNDCRQIRSWFKRQPDRRLKFRLQGSSIAEAYNRGIFEARGKYIAFIQPGDLWHPDKLAKQISALNRHPEVGLVHSYSVSIDLQGHLTGMPDEQGFADGSYQTSDLLSRSEILAENRLNLSTVMLRRQCFEVVGGFDRNLVVIPDWEMWIRLSRYYQFMTVAEPLVYFRQYPTGFRHDCDRLEPDLQATIEKVYAYLPPERSRQKHLSYSYASLFLAEQTLYHKHPNSAIARNYLYQALQHDFLLALTPKFCHLRWLVFVLSYRQSNGYRHLLLLMQTALEQLQLAVFKAGEYCHKTIEWLLEEEESLNFVKDRRAKRRREEVGSNK